MKIRSSEQLESFVSYCKKNPELRFWQALRNWSGYNFIYGSQESVEGGNLEDTFYKE